MNGHGSLAAFFGALSLGVASFGGFVLPKLSSGGSSGDGKLEAQVVVSRDEQAPTRPDRPCPRHTPPGDWPTV